MVEKEYILRLIRMFQDWRAFCLKGQDMNLEFGEAIDLPFIGLIVDMMGFPEDNTMSQREMFGNGALTHPNTYCRDYLFNFFYNEITGLTEEEIYQELEEFLQEIKEYKRTNS